MAKTKPSETTPDAPEVAGTTETNSFRPIRDIVRDLTQPVRMRHLDKRKQGNKDIHYLSWHNAVKYLDLYAPGWNYEIRRIDNVAGKLILTTRVSIPCAEGIVYREATGQEDETKETFGDSSSNAESMSLRRACAKFGLGLYLYENEGWRQSIETNQPKPASVPPPNTQANTTPKPETAKVDAPPAVEADGVAISDEQLKTLIGLCEKPPKRKEPCDKNGVAKHFSKGRTEMLEDLLASEAVAAMDFIRELKETPAKK